jgi:hypothetical protein
MPRMKPEDLEPASSFDTASNFKPSKFEETVISTRRSDAPMSSRQADTSSNNVGDAEILVKNTNEDWINKKWRPAMGWVYMATCTFDFVIAPILWSVLQAVQGGQVTNQWVPLTLQGAGLYHVAMGAVLGIAAFGRTKEKVAGAN